MNPIRLRLGIFALLFIIAGLHAQPATVHGPASSIADPTFALNRAWQFMGLAMDDLGINYPTQNVRLYSITYPEPGKGVYLQFRISTGTTNYEGGRVSTGQRNLLIQLDNDGKYVKPSPEIFDALTFGGIRRRNPYRVQVKIIEGTSSRDYDFTLVRTIERHWYKQIEGSRRELSKGKTMLTLHLHPNGAVTNIKVESSNADVIEACSSSVMESGPFPPWPAEVRTATKSEYREIRLQFSLE